MRQSFILAIGIIALSGCAASQFSKPVSLGTAGTIIGGGAGALVGTLISNGDVGMSAALGAGVGAAAGIIAGYYVEQEEQAELVRIREEISSQQRDIDARQKEIDALHQRALDESQRGEPDDSMRGRLYDGPTLGNAFR